MTDARSPITMSVFDLLKAGPGPSSSHTIAPMRAGADFAALARGLDRELLARVRGVRVRLLGSLSATGPGHGTDRAVVAGLMGHEPETCPPKVLNDLPNLPAEKRLLSVPGLNLPVSVDNVEYGPIHHDHPFSNTLFIELLAAPFPPEGSRPPLGSAEPDPLARQVLWAKEYYSVGGGFLQWKGWEPEERGRPRHLYHNLTSFRARLEESGLTLEQLMLENEMAVTGAGPAAVYQGLDRLLDLMADTVRRGGEEGGKLPGPIGLKRKSAKLRERADSLSPFERDLCLLNSYAYGASEENAAGHIVVTAPTCGAAGVVPAVAAFMRDHLRLGPAALRGGLLAATLIGFSAKHNAGIAGAEVGCQGEVGVATAMAAAMVAQGRGYSARVVENAAEIALEHQLGLTCDPVGGFVQIPCIERNAVGAVKALNAAVIAANEDLASHVVSLDVTVQAMAEIGREMSCKFKETSTGGLAVSLPMC